MSAPQPDKEPESQGLLSLFDAAVDSFLLKYGVYLVCWAVLGLYTLLWHTQWSPVVILIGFILPLLHWTHVADFRKADAAGRVQIILWCKLKLELITLLLAFVLANLYVDAGPAAAPMVKVSEILGAAFMISVGLYPVGFSVLLWVKGKRLEILLLLGVFWTAINYWLWTSTMSRPFFPGAFRAPFGPVLGVSLIGTYFLMKVMIERDKKKRIDAQKHHRRHAWILPVAVGVILLAGVFLLVAFLGN